MELIRLTHENLETEHICCAISNNKDTQVMQKADWGASPAEKQYWIENGWLTGGKPWRKSD